MMPPKGIAIPPRETPAERYVRTTTGRCDPKTEARISVITERDRAADPLRCDQDPSVRTRKATPAELAAFDARTESLRGDPAPASSPAPRVPRTPPGRPLTSNDHAVWRAIAAHVAAHDAPPSRRELHRLTGVGSLDAIGHCLERLTAAGIVRSEPGIHRGIVLLEQPVLSDESAEEAA